MSIIASLYDRLVLALLQCKSGIEIGRQARFKSHPDVLLVKGARIIIGEGVVINSRNRGYHLSMFARVKLMADCPGALISIGELTRLHGSCVHARQSIKIGKRCLIAANCTIIDSSGHDLSFDDPSRRILTKGETNPIVIEDDVWIGANSMVLPGVNIGRGSVIAAGSVVSSSIPPMCLAAGVPAKIIKRYENVS